MWLSGLSTRVAGSIPSQGTCQVPSRGHVRGNHTFMFLSLSFSLPSFFLKINKWNLKKEEKLSKRSIVLIGASLIIFSFCFDKSKTFLCGNQMWGKWMLRNSRERQAPLLVAGYWQSPLLVGWCSCHNQWLTMGSSTQQVNVTGFYQDSWGFSWFQAPLRWPSVSIATSLVCPYFLFLHISIQDNIVQHAVPEQSGRYKRHQNCNMCTVLPYVSFWALCFIQHLDWSFLRMFLCRSF